MAFKIINKEANCNQGEELLDFSEAYADDGCAWRFRVLVDP